jgi:HEAT repeat protein
MSPWTSILLLMTVFLLSLDILLFFGFLGHRLRTERFRRDLERRTLEYSRALGRLYSDNVDPPRPRNLVDHLALYEASVGLFLDLRGKERERIHDFWVRSSAFEFFRERTNHRVWTHRFEALEVLGTGRFPQAKDIFIRLALREKVLWVRMAAIWGLSRTVEGEDDLVMLAKFVDSLVSSSKFKEFIFTESIHTLREEGKQQCFLRLLAIFREFSPYFTAARKEAVEACGAAGLVEAADEIVRIYDTFRADPLMRITCTRALGRLGAAEGFRVIREGLMDEDWRVRAIAAKAAPVCGPEVVPQLNALLYDRVYIVRMNAAEALSCLGEQGAWILSREVESPDSFVRDIARFVLARLKAGIASPLGARL